MNQRLDSAKNKAQLRAGIVGAGLMGRWHADAIRHAGESVAAVMDLNAPAAQQLASRYDAPAFSELEPLFAHAALDVLHVCTPLSTHADIVRRALDAGLHVLVEKPLTSHPEETEELLHQAQKAGLLLCPVHQFLFQESVRKVRARWSQLGRILHLEGTFYSAGGEGKNPAALDDIVADILPHPLSLMHAFLPDGLSREGWTTIHPETGELRAACSTSGPTLSITISMHARPTVCAFKIVGTKATMHLNLFHGYVYRMPGAASRVRKIINPFDEALRALISASVNLGRRALHWQPAYPGLRELVKAFHRALRHGMPPPLSWEAIVAVARERDLLVHHAELHREELT